MSRPPMDTEGTIALLGRILRGVPALPGAACRDETATFDLAADNDSSAVTAAQRICAACPALDRCAEWYDQLPARRRPPGVIAGQINPRPTGRRDRTTKVSEDDRIA